MAKKLERGANAPSITRRDFIKAASAAAGVGALGGVGTLTGCDDSSSSPGYGSNLRILVSSLYVASYGAWFESLAQEWGEANGVTVTVDTVTLGQIPTEGASDIASNHYYDLIEFMAPPGRYENQVVDLTDLNEEAQSRYGEQVALCRASSFNPVPTPGTGSVTDGRLILATTTNHGGLQSGCRMDRRRGKSSERVERRSWQTIPADP